MALIRYVHKISPSAADVKGPFPSKASDFGTLEAARRWFARHGVKLGRVRSSRHEKGNFVVFPSSGIWHAIIAEGVETDTEFDERLRNEWAAPGSNARRGSVTPAERQILEKMGIKGR